MKEKLTKHKITNDIQKKIYVAANALPIMAKYVNGAPVYKAVEVLGSELTQADLKPGTPLIPDVMYRVKRLVYVNHFQEMIHLVQRDGPGAIPIYKADCMAQLAMFKADAKKKKSFINKLILNLNLLWLKIRKK